MPNKKAEQFAKLLGRPVPTSSQPTTKTRTAPATSAPLKPIISGRPGVQVNAKARPAFRPQAFKPARGK